MTFRPVLRGHSPVIPAYRCRCWAAVFWLQQRAMSYIGPNLLFNLAVPIALATIAQMLVMR